MHAHILIMRRASSLTVRASLACLSTMYAGVLACAALTNVRVCPFDSGVHTAAALIAKIQAERQV